MDRHEMWRSSREIEHSIATEISQTIQSFLRFFSNALEPAAQSVYQLCLDRKFLP